MGIEARGSPILIACRLTDAEQRPRRDELSRELDDGYEFLFAGGAA